MSLTTGLVLGGAVEGWTRDGPEAHRTAFVIFGMVGGFIVAAYVRILVVGVLLPIWRHRALASRLTWMALQAGCTVGGAWACMAGNADQGANPVLTLMFGAVCGFSFGAFITGVWVRLSDLARYTIPALVRRTAQQQHRR